MVSEENKMLPVEDEKAELAEVADLIDEITPDLEELSGRMARIRQLLNSEDTSPKERREALKTIGEIFKYGMCEGFCIRRLLEMQSTNNTVARLRLVILHEGHLDARLRGEVTHAEALEEISSGVPENTGLYNLQSFYFCVNYVHFQSSSADTVHTGSSPSAVPHGGCRRP